MQQISLFDYAALDSETRIIVQQRTLEIKGLMKRAAQDIIDIGQRLIEVQELLRHNKQGGFEGWLHAEFTWNSRTAYRFMTVATNFDNLSGLDIAPSALYLLAAPSTPEAARLEALELAGGGTAINHSLAKTIINNHRDGEDTDDLPFTPEPSIYDDEDDGEDIPQPARPPHVTQNTGNHEWYTPSKYIEAARAVMGGIDLDPASSVIANRTVKAAWFYTIEDDGLSQEWHGRIWLNPPYSSGVIDKFANKLCKEYCDERVTEAIILVNNATETAWFREIAAQAGAVVFPMSRIRFLDSDGIEGGGPLQGQAFLYIGPQPRRFLTVFRAFGWGGPITI